MTEDEARDRARTIVGGAAMDRLVRLVDLVVAENDRQNLVARSTMPAIWNRHVLDSVQLLQWAGPSFGTWLDIGTGGGFPGLAIAAVTDRDTVLVEPRKLRATFLADAAQVMGLTRCCVVTRKIEQVDIPASIVSARAVAPVEKLLQGSTRCATASTRWLLLRGRSSPDEIAALERRWGMVFHVEQSLTDPDSSVFVIDRGARS